jgi:hypothetical protein
MIVLMTRWLAAVSLCALSISSAALAQSGPAGGPPQRGNNADASEDDIVVTGQKPRGSVIGDIQPEVQLNAGDVRALGVSSINDLLTELGPQLESARGGSPLVLLEGHRVSSFREIATIPAEAIQRVDILPEEVALKYGQAPDQKVLNIVLRSRFHATTLEAKDRLVTDGGADQAGASLDALSIRRASRVNLSAAYGHTDKLMESQRGITTDNGGDTLRTLVPSDQNLTINGSYYRPLASWLTGTINAELTTDQTLGNLGPMDTSGLLAGGVPLERSTSEQTLHLGTTLNADGRVWHSTLTATYDRDETRTLSDRRFEGGQPQSGDYARGTSDVGTVDLTVNGSLYKLPAGDVSLTVHAGGSASGIDSYSIRSDLVRFVPLDRSAALGGISLDVPLVNSPSPGIGRLSVNGNYQVQSLSDAGTLQTYGFGLNWSPVKIVGLIASYNDAETAPTVQQLGNPLTVSPFVPVYDTKNQETVNVPQITGGNPALTNQERKDWRLGLTLTPLKDPSVTITVSYNHSLIDNAVGALPALNAATEAAYPDRFIRDADGALISVDARPVNIAHEERNLLRWGINFTKRLKTPQSQIDAMRAAFARRFPNGMPDRPSGEGGDHGGQFGGGSGAGQSAGGQGAEGRGGGGFGGGGFGGGGGRGGAGGRLNFAVYHSWYLTDRAVLQDGQPEIDLLNGGALKAGGGQPRHVVEVQTGYSQSGLGVRLTGNWQSATNFIDPTTPASDLHFGSLATLNLRFFANLGQMPALMKNNPWLRGARVTLAVNNLFNERMRVTNPAGVTPTAYLPAYLDPLGRTVTLSIRKAFF